MVGFDWLEYVVFSVTLTMSALIGVYFGCIKDGQDTVDGYLLGGKRMKLLPISASLVCSFISGVTLLGVPTEIYTHGTQFLSCGISILLSGLICSYVILPVFYKLQMLSLFQYLEMRFDKNVRRAVSFIYTACLLLYIAIVIYGPALALNQVSGLNVHLVTVTVSVVCIFYTTIGGLKAVVWTDTLQGAVMVTSMLLVAMVGTTKVGGFARVFEVAEHGGRLELLNLDPDPRQRSTFWSVTIGLTVLWTTQTATNPSYVQRCTALPTIRKSRWATLYWGVGVFFFIYASGYMGLVLYANYKDCDPLRSGLIQRPDQLLPHFIVDEISRVRGLPGVFVASIVCAALSTISTGVNTVAGTLYSDFIEERLSDPSEKVASRYLKGLSLLFGALTVALVFLIERLGTILMLTYSVGGANGIILGVFVLGLFFPQSTSKGAYVGALASFAVISWILVGSNTAQTSGLIVPETKGTSIAECAANATFREMPPARFGEAFPLFELSVYYYSPLGALLTVLIGLITSYATGSNPPGKVNRDLISPLVWDYVRTYSTVPTKEVELDKL